VTYNQISNLRNVAHAENMKTKVLDNNVRFGITCAFHNESCAGAKSIGRYITLCCNPKIKQETLQERCVEKATHNFSEIYDGSKAA
jgi:hypothetical protein